MAVSLQTELAKRLPLIRGDRIQLQQIVLNLMMNAVEANERCQQGSRDLLISTAEDNRTACSCLCEIRARD